MPERSTARPPSARRREPTVETSRHDYLIRAVMVALALLLAFLARPVNAVTLQDIAPDFTLKSLSGEHLRLHEYRGQVVLINFWASWCGPCRQELPLLDRMHQRYVDTGFAVLGVNVEGDEKPARALIDTIPVSFPVLIDEGQAVSELYRLEAMPSSVVVDRDGVVRYIHRGYKPGDEPKYVEVIRDLIRE
jgi:peroxiredoxin